MPTENEDNGPRRRVVLRRGRSGGFSGGGAGASTRSESLRTSSADEIGDDVDAAIDPHEMNRRVRERAVLPSPMRELPPPTMGSPDDARDSPRLRLNQVQMAGSAAYAKEYRLSLLHRLLMRNVPLDQIAQQLQVSISTVEKDRAELKKRLREAAKEMDINEMIGGQNAFYDEIQGMSLRVASGGGEGQQAVPVPMKLAAMRTALAANADRTRFLSTAGVFDVLRFRRSEDGTDLSDVQMLMMRTAELLTQVDDEEEPESESAARRPKRISRSKRPGTFGPMTFDDPDASGSGNEIQEL